MNAVRIRVSGRTPGGTLLGSELGHGSPDDLPGTVSVSHPTTSSEYA